MPVRALVSESPCIFKVFSLTSGGAGGITAPCIQLMSPSYTAAAGGPREILGPPFSPPLFRNSTSNEGGKMKRRRLAQPDLAALEGAPDGEDHGVGPVRRAAELAPDLVLAEDVHRRAPRLRDTPLD